jgi:hypothetical protein
MGAKETEPSLMRNLGAFFGHIVQAIKEDPTEPDQAKPASPKPASVGAHSTEAGAAEKSEHNASDASNTLEVRREIQEARHGPYLLRRTTIDEVIRTPEGTADKTPDDTPDDTPDNTTDVKARGDSRPRDGSEGSHASH